MELLKVTLFFVLLIAVSAKPVPPDADIPDKDQSHERTDGQEKTSSLTAAQESQESSESDSVEEGNSSEETTNQPTADGTTAAMTTITSGDGSTVAPEPDTMNTNVPTVMVVETTPRLATTAGATSPCSPSECFTEEVPTAAPVTQVRGDM